jgi:hypothetical protein
MDIGDQSVNFIEGHLDDKFRKIMEKQLIKDMYWIETEIGARCVATLFDVNDESSNNLIALFPPFTPIDN